MKNPVQTNQGKPVILNYQTDPTRFPFLECAVGVMVYNEEANIGKVLERLLNQRTKSALIYEIVVVASGCTDRTVEIVRCFEELHSLIRVIEQPRREGKASAINLFLEETSADIAVLINGDTLPREDTVEQLVAPFHEAQVGMTGGRAMPLNFKERFMGFAVHLMWEMHDRVARRNPKLGEAVAWRRQVGFLPPETAVDEVSLEAMVKRMGYTLVYQPEAIVYNKGPETVNDFLKQRRRIHAGHLQTLQVQGYRAATINNRAVLRSLLESIKWEPRWLSWAAATVILEIAGRTLGRYDYYTNKSHTVWQQVETTKVLAMPEQADIAKQESA